MTKDEFLKELKSIDSQISVDEFLYNHGMREYFQKIMGLIGALAASIPEDQWWTQTR